MCGPMAYIVMGITVSGIIISAITICGPMAHIVMAIIILAIIISAITVCGPRAYIVMAHNAGGQCRLRGLNSYGLYSYGP